jgi:hypothetical protein
VPLDVVDIGHQALGVDAAGIARSATMRSLRGLLVTDHDEALTEGELRVFDATALARNLEATSKPKAWQSQSIAIAASG